MQNIRIDAGVYTSLRIDLSKVDFTGAKKVVFTIKNFPEVTSPEIVEREFTEPKVYNIVITPEESINLTTTAEYDFDIILDDDSRYKLTENGKIILRRSVGDDIE